MCVMVVGGTNALALARLSSLVRMTAENLLSHASALRTRMRPPRSSFVYRLPPPKINTIFGRVASFENTHASSPRFLVDEQR